MYIILILFFEWRQILIENDLKNFWGVEVIKSTMTFVEQSNSFYWKGIVRSEIPFSNGACRNGSCRVFVLGIAMMDLFYGLKL